MFEKQNIEIPNSVRFIGRREYLDDLESLWRKATSSLVACRGRRRIARHSTSPTPTDFDGDGIPELVLGAEDGFIYRLGNRPKSP